MGFPSFSKQGVTTVTFSQGAITPDVIDEGPRQVINEAENGEQSVYTLSGAALTHLLAFQDLSSADHDALLAFLRNPLIDYAGETFTYTDTDSVAHTVRYIDRSLRRMRNASGGYDIALTLRELL